jgi:hypothetical protein
METAIPDYILRLEALTARLNEQGVDMTGSVVGVFVRHDKWCPLYLGGGTTCFCRPEVEIRIGDVTYGEDAHPIVAANVDGGEYAT